MTIAGSKLASPAFTAEGAGITEFIIISHKDGKKADIKQGIQGQCSFKYYESILQDVVRATVTFIDTGDSVDGKSVKEGLPITGEEKSVIKIVDNNDESLEVELAVNKPKDVYDDTRKKITGLSFASTEFFRNERVRVSSHMEGLVSQSVKSILTQSGGESTGGEKKSKTIEYLDTEKEVFIEKSSNKWTFNGNGWKCFWWINRLAREAIPSGENVDEGKIGDNAGFMFWETSEGFHFKSVDGLMNTETNKPKKRFIYNETPEGPCSANLPERYDAKVLEFSAEGGIDVQSKLEKGTYSNHGNYFNPYNTYMQSVDVAAGNFPTDVKPIVNAKGRHEYLKLAGKEFPTLDTDTTATRNFWNFEDTGTNSSGSVEEQIKDSKKSNWSPENTKGQATARLNQLFAFQVTITIPGDFSLHAGDAVYFDAPGLRSDKKEVSGNEQLDKHIGGNYIIMSLVHYLDGSNTLTKLTLVRDSFGRKPQDRTDNSTTGDSTSSSGKFKPIPEVKMSGFNLSLMDVG